MTEPSTPETPAVQDETKDRFATEYTEVELVCPRCQVQWSPTVARFVNAETHPMAKEGILRKSMHRARCPSCRRYELEVDQIFDYYDPQEKLVIQFRPAWEFKAGGGEEIYWVRLEQLIEKYAGDDVRVDVVFGFDDMIAKHLGGDEAVAAAQERAEQERAEGKAPGSIAIEQAVEARASRGSSSQAS